jgi:XTP/dITP diphosphohydrolase
MKKLLIATKNPGKFKEYKIIFKDFLKLDFDLVSLNDLGIKEEIEEKGENYKENAVLKAKFYCKLSGLPTLADDSGLEIEILNGWPGVKTRRARENGKGASDEELIGIMMKKLENIPLEKRKVKDKVVIALAFPNRNRVYSFEGEREGFIAKRVSKKKWKGFPCASIFYLPGKRKILSELTLKERVYFSHRKVALEKALPILKKVLL